jgi:cobalamin biosynthesis protein CobT
MDRIDTLLPDLGSRLERIARSLSGNEHIRILFNKDNCSTDGEGRIYLPANCDKLSETDMDLVWGYVNHESEHVLVQLETKAARAAGERCQVNPRILALVGRSASYAIHGKMEAIPLMELMKKLPTPSRRMWFNVFEDIRIERRAGERYIGVYNHLRHARERSIEDWKSRIDKESLLFGVSCAIIFAAHGHDIAWIPEEHQKVYDELLPFSSYHDEMKSVYDAYNLALAVADFVEERSEEAREEMAAIEAKKTAKSEKSDGDDGAYGGKGEEEEGEEEEGEEEEGEEEEGEEEEEGSGDGEEGEDDEEGDADGGDDGDGGDDEEDGSGDKGGVGEDEADGGEVGDDGGSDEGEAGDDGDDDGDEADVELLKALLDLSKEPTATDIYAKVLELLIIEASRSEAPALNPYSVNPEALKQDRLVQLNPDKVRATTIRDGVADQTLTLAQQMRILLTTRSVARRIPDQDAGKLDRRSLYRLNRPGYLPATNVFEQKIPGRSYKLAITVLVDCSGSMSGSKINLALQAATLLGDTLHQLGSLGVRFAVTGFTADQGEIGHGGRAAGYAGHRWVGGHYSRTDAVVHYPFKRWDEDWTRVWTRVGGLAGGAGWGSCLRNNADADSVKWAARDLYDQRADRHILLVLSDGEPACAGNMDEQSAELKRVVKMAMKAGIEVWGIGIEDASVRSFYKNWRVVANASQLSRTIIEVARLWFDLSAR